MIRKVLFVYDDQNTLLSKEEHAASYQDMFSIEFAKDTVAAEKLLKENPISLIVMGQKLPHADDMNFLAHVREKYPDISVVVVSEHRTPEIDELSNDRDILTYICKPFPIEALGKVIIHRLQKESDGGIMHDVSLSTFLQFMEMESKTCTIRMIDKISKKAGVLYFINGRLINARVGQSNGLKAAYRAFGWEKTTIFIQNTCETHKDLINSDLQSIILKAAGMKDEGDDLLDTDKKPNKKQKKKSSTTGLRQLLNKEVGERSGLEEIYPDQSVDHIVTFMDEFGELFNLGRLKVGFVDIGQQSNKVILPGQPPTTLKINPNGFQDKIIQVLIDYYQE